MTACQSEADSPWPYRVFHAFLVCEASCFGHGGSDVVDEIWSPSPQSAQAKAPPLTSDPYGMLSFVIVPPLTGVHCTYPARSIENTEMVSTVTTVENVLTFSKATKVFGDVTAVDKLDIEVPTASVTVILGPNGAGKTTTIRLATGVFELDSGSVRTFGLDPRTDGEEVRSRTGVVPPKPAMYDRLTGRDNLVYAAQLHRLAKPDVDGLADRFGIGHALHLDVGGYSTGMRTRLALARSLLHDPELLLLDEPTAGLDPESAYAVRELIFEMARAGKTVVMSTHLLHEADGTADQIVMMNGGSAWETGSPEDLIARYWRTCEVRLDADDGDGLLRAVADLNPKVLAAGVTVQLEDASQIPSLVDRLVRDGHRLRRVEPVAPTLERLYFAMRREVTGVDGASPERVVRE